MLNGHALAGLYQLTDDRIHWFLDDPAPRRTSENVPALEVQERVRGWPPVVCAAVTSTQPSSILYNEVRDLQPYRPWGEGRVTLLGDAAHPMLLTLGQGACQAIEDPAALVRGLDSRDDVVTALRSYERQRSRRVAAFVRAYRRSWDLRSRVPAGPRDALLRATPSGLLSFLFGRTIRPAKIAR